MTTIDICQAIRKNLEDQDARFGVEQDENGTAFFTITYGFNIVNLIPSEHPDEYFEVEHSGQILDILENLIAGWTRPEIRKEVDRFTERNNINVANKMYLRIYLAQG